MCVGWDGLLPFLGPLPSAPQVISMTARLLDGGNPEVCGMMTSGGTESIVLAAKAHRDFYRQVRGCFGLWSPRAKIMDDDGGAFVIDTYIYGNQSDMLIGWDTRSVDDVLMLDD